MPRTQPPPSFFIVPDEKRNYESSVQLGNVIYEVAKPHLVLLRPDEASPSLALGQLPEKKTLQNYRIEKGGQKSSKYGLFTKILDFFGLGVNFSHTRGTEASESYEIKSITFEYFDPPPRFLEGVKEQKAIMDILKDGEPPCAFLITGVVVATGVVFKSSYEKDREYDGSLGVNVGGASVGPSGRSLKKGTLKIDWEAEEPIVLAFKVQKLQLKRDKLTAEDEVDGAYFGDDSKPIKDDLDSDAALDELDVEWMTGHIVEDEFGEGTYKLYLPDE